LDKKEIQTIAEIDAGLKTTQDLTREESIMTQEEKIELLATKVMGWKLDENKLNWLRKGEGNWNPYASIADAWMIVEKLEINDYFWRSHRSLHNKVSFTFFLITDTEPPLYQCCGTLQEAICEAALKTIRE